MLTIIAGLTMRYTKYFLLLIAVFFLLPVVRAVPTLTVVDSIGVVGVFPSLVLNASGFPVMSYYDRTNTRLKVAVCGNATCTAGNILTPLDAGATPDITSSLALNASGFPVISYWFNNNLKLIVCGNATCTVGNTVTTIDSGVAALQFISMTLNASGNPVIGYQGSTGLKVVVCGDATCTSGNAITTVDSGSAANGLSLVLNASGFPVISYGTSTTLKVAVCGNATCTAGNTITLVDSSPDGILRTSVALNASGFPVIAAYYTFEGLHVVVCGDAACTAGNTNTLVDNDIFAGVYLRMNLNSSGFPVIGYLKANFLNVAVCGNADCTAANTLTPVEMDGGVYATLTLNASDFPVLAYMGGNIDLKVAVCDTTTCAIPEIDVQEGGISIPDGTGSFNFGTTLVGTPLSRTFTILNTGGFNLAVGAITVPAGFTATSTPANPVVSGGSTTFTVQCDAASTGIYSGTISIVNDDTTENPYNFTLNCTVNNPDPQYTSLPAPATTILLNGAAGTTQNASIAVSNIGPVNSLLDVTLVSISGGYTIAGLPVVGLPPSSPAVNMDVSCVVPQAAGTLVVFTNEPGNPQYIYNLTCAAPPVLALTNVPGSALLSTSNSSNSQPEIDIFDPAISKIGLLLPGQVGVQNERLKWVVTVSNPGTVVFNNITITDNLRPELRIDSVDAPGGTVRITGQTVTVTYAALQPGQSVQFNIFTTVLRGIRVDNTACLRMGGTEGKRCVTGQVVSSLPATGEIPRWHNNNTMLVLMGAIFLSAGLWLLRWMRRVY